MQKGSVRTTIDQLFKVYEDEHKLRTFTPNDDILKVWGLTMTAFNRVRKGDKIPSLDQAVLIAEFLKIPVDSLYNY